MNTKINEFLHEWKITSHFGEKRSYTVTDLPMIPGEFTVILKIEVTAKIDGHSKEISKERKLHTYAQGESRSNVNPDGDLHRIRVMANDLEKDFFEQFNKAITEMLQEINPDGFF